jgi:hypothetical protein
MVSRVRLRAARIEPGQDEPTLVEDGPAAELVDELGGGTVGGRAQMMYDFATQTSVPGECWLTGENRNGVQEWLVRSTDEIRRGSRSRDGVMTYEVVDLELSSGNEVKWRPLGQESLVVRVWRQHARYHHLADSAARVARPVMRELELVNRHITAQYLSRLASAGIVLFPEEITFPVREEFQDEDDPFVLEWIETAKEAISTPGTAAAVIPIPLRLPMEAIDKVKHIDFTIKLDDKILDKRDSAIRRLATQLDLPAEVLLGMGDINHWGQWMIEESAVKTHISPVVERITHSLTIGYLHPRLKAGGKDAELAEWVIWYDASEITQRPDRSKTATEAYDRIELSGAALRREGGFNEDDKPQGKELREQLLKRIAADPALAPSVVEELTGQALEIAPSPGEPEDGESEPQDDETDQRGEPEPEEDEAGASPMVASLQDLVAQAQTIARDARATRRHWLVKSISGVQIRHPNTCGLLPVRCPYDAAVKTLTAGPGMSGTYECSLSPDETHLLVGRLRPDMSKRDDDEPIIPAGVNGANPGA